MAASVRRDNFKSFWDQYSDQPDTNSMMLNHSADELESADRADILAALPHLANKDVVDIGAGIGRFTTVLAETAKSVLSTDFIESFIAKNQERNAHIGNVNYQVGDAVHLKMEPNSVDLVFTNWLMMYLSDTEAVEFIFNCQRWLRADGFVHLRESCSEPSTGRTKENTMHKGDSNPTHYRFSSLYIKLLRAIRYRDQDGKLWKFDLQWSCSVPTYVKRQHNWRQVHWLARKVAAEEGDKETTPAELVQLISKTWYEEQQAWDAKLDGEKYIWTDDIFSRALDSKDINKNSTVLVYTPRQTSPSTHVNSHLMAEKFTCNVWNIETKCNFYRTSLTKANALKDKRVRYSWNKDLNSAVNYWQQRSGEFEALVATELLATATDSELELLPTVMSTDAKVYLIEPVDSINEQEIVKRLGLAGVKNVSVEDVSQEAFEGQQKYNKEHNVNFDIPAKKWILIKGNF